MKKNVMRILASTLLLSVCLTSCLSNEATTTTTADTTTTDTTTAAAPAESTTTQEVEYTLRMSGIISEEHLIGRSMTYFADRCAELSDGRVEIELYFNNVMGDAREMVEATAMGNWDIVSVGSMDVAGYTSAFKFFNLPFLWESKGAATEFLTNTEAGQAVKDQLFADTGLMPMCYLDNGFFNVTANKIISTPDDVVGFKMRCQESDVLLQIWEDLGASPTPLAYSELYTALQQGAVDGMMNGYVTINDGGFAEVQDYVMKLGVVYDRAFFLIGAPTMESLPEDILDIVLQAASEAEAWCIENATEGYQTALDTMIADGMEVIDLSDNRDIWVEKAQGTYDWFRTAYPEVDLDAILETAAECNAMYPADDADVM